jgi:aquaporin Z
LFFALRMSAFGGKADMAYCTAHVAGFAPIAIGLTLTFVHLAAIPVSNASVNPARSTATAIFGGGAALSSLWLFWVAPIVGGVIGGYVSRWLQED